MGNLSTLAPQAQYASMETKALVVDEPAGLSCRFYKRYQMNFRWGGGKQNTNGLGEGSNSRIDRVPFHFLSIGSCLVPSRSCVNTGFRRQDNKNRVRDYILVLL